MDDLTFEGFIRECKKSNLLNNPGARAVFNFLANPLNTYRMIMFSDLGLPALNGVASQLEDMFYDDETFPLSEPKNRQIVGMMIRYIMGLYGYVPVIRKDNVRLRYFSKARGFKTGAVYKLKEMPKYCIVANIVEVE